MTNPTDPKKLGSTKEETTSSLKKEISSMIEEIFKEKYDAFKNQIDSVMQRAIDDIREEAEFVSTMCSFFKKTRDKFPNLNHFKWVKIKIDLSLVELKLVDSLHTEENEKIWVISFPQDHKYKELTVNTVHDLHKAKYLSFYIPLGIKKSRYLFITDEVNQIEVFR